MKKIGIVFVFLLIFSQVAFAAENHGFYVGISGGYVIPNNMTISDPDSGETYADAPLKNGGMVGVTTGWLTPFTKRILALELEYNYIFRTDFDSSKVVSDFMGDGPGTLDANVNIHAVMFNAKARYPEGWIHPYVGGGIGYAYFQIGDFTATSSEGLGTITAKGDWGGGLCWQLMAGVDFDINPNMSVGIGYKYFASKPTIGKSDSDNIYTDVDYKTSVATVGFTYIF